MNREHLRSAIVAFIDDQDNAGLEVESDEILDIARTLPDHPREEAELGLVVYEVLSTLLEDGVITAYTKVSAKEHPWADITTPPPVFLSMAPMPEEEHER